MSKHKVVAALTEAVAHTRGEPTGARVTPYTIHAMSFGEQFVDLLGEFMDAHEQYAHSRRQIGGEYANRDEMDKAGNALQALLDRRFP